jgi:muconate cycloisomerase
MTARTIRTIRAHEVIVPTHPDVINSPGLDKPLHKIPLNARKSWSVQFDQLPKLLIELELADGTVGLGELYRGHDWHNVESIADILLGQDIESLCRQEMPFAKTREHDGFEIAIWDAYAKVHGLRVVDLLGGCVRTHIPVSAWSGQRVVADVAELAARYHQLGFSCLKFKCSIEDDVVAWASEVARAAPGMSIIFDPNERFNTPADTRQLAERLAAVGNVLCLEDPIPHWMRAEYRDLRLTSKVPIVRHIALPYPMLGNRIEDVVTAVQNREVDGFNFNAGLADFQRLDHVADLAGLPCWHGSEIDLGVLEAAYLHSCAAARSCTWPSDIFGRFIRTHDLLRQPLTFEPPYAHLPTGPGLGVELDHDAVAEHSASNSTTTLWPSIGSNRGATPPHDDLPQPVPCRRGPPRDLGHARAARH